MFCKIRRNNAKKCVVALKFCRALPIIFLRQNIGRTAPGEQKKEIITAEEAEFMEIKRINGVISAYKTTRKGAAVKSEAASTAKNTDRVEFGFDTALQAAKNGISAAVKADAAPQEIAQARQTMDSVEPGDIASYIIFG